MIVNMKDFFKVGSRLEIIGKLRDLIFEKLKVYLKFINFCIQKLVKFIIKGNDIIQ